MKKIDAWKTDDGNVWETEDAALEHERRTKGEGLIRDIYYNRMVDCDNDLIDFLDDHKKAVLEFYGIIPAE